jgi:hypothetical protein
MMQIGRTLIEKHFDLGHHGILGLGIISRHPWPNQRAA